MFLIKLILFFFLFAFIMGVAIAVSLFRKLHSAARQFQDQMNGMGGGQSPHTDSRTSAENVFENRTHKPTAQKIIPKDEGEYVDFEETT